MATTTAVPVSEETYREIALGDPKWELHCGQLREKPGMSVEHGHVIDRLQRQLYLQLDPGEHTLRTNHARLRLSADTYYVPDIVIVPTGLELALRERPGSLDAYPESLPLVIEVWSPSTGGYDINEKLPDYQQRGDREIWFVHPYEHTLTAWRRSPDGSYAKAVYRNGMVRADFLPSVAIDLEALLRPDAEPGQRSASGIGDQVEVAVGRLFPHQTDLRAVVLVLD